MKAEDIKPGLKFKSVRAIDYITERGEQRGDIEGEVVSIVSHGKRINMKGLMYDFSIRTEQFLTLNKFKN